MSNKKKLVILVIILIILVLCNVLIILNYINSNKLDNNDGFSNKETDVKSNFDMINVNTDNLNKENDLEDNNIFTDIQDNSTGNSDSDDLLNNRDNSIIDNNNQVTNTPISSDEQTSLNNDNNQNSFIDSTDVDKTIDDFKDDSNSSTPDNKPNDNESNDNSIGDNNSSTDFYYSITGGIKEYSTSDECLQVGEEIAFKELEEVLNYNEQHIDNQIDVDIKYYRCLPVQDEYGTGWFLNIYCNSGNCNEKYK